MGRRVIGDGRFAMQQLEIETTLQTNKV